MAYSVGGTVETQDIADRFWDDYLNPQLSTENFSPTSYNITGVDGQGSPGSGWLTNNAHGTNSPSNVSQPGDSSAGVSRALNNIGTSGSIIDASDIYDAIRGEAARFSHLRSVRWRARERHRTSWGGTYVNTDRIGWQTKRRYYGSKTTFSTTSDPLTTATGEVIDIGSSTTDDSIERMLDWCRDQFAARRNATLNIGTTNVYTCHTSCHSSCHGSRSRR